MGNYAATADVSALVGRTIDTTSVPTAAQTLTSIGDIEADLDGELAAIDLTTPITGASPILICKRAVAHAAAAQFLRNKDSVTDTAESVAQIEAFQAIYDKFVKDIRENPSLVASKLGQAYGSTANRGVFRSHITDNSHSKSVADGDFDPVFSKDDEP